MKALFFIISGLVAVSCSHYGNQSGSEIRKPSSESSEEVVEGIVKQAECNRPTGYGAVEIQSVERKVVQSSWYKVNSQELCSKVVPSAVFNNATKLGELGFQNNIGQIISFSRVTIKDGFVVDVQEIKKVDSVKYFKGIKSYESNDSQREVMDWYFQNRRSH